MIKSTLLEKPVINYSEIVRDPVCGMKKPQSEFKLTSVYNGLTYYFCSSECKHMFEAFPRGYVGQ